MTKLEFKLNEQGVRELLQSDAMRGIIASAAAEKARQAGPGYESEVNMGKKRLYANIYPGSAEAAKDNYEHNTLEKVIRT